MVPGGSARRIPPNSFGYADRAHASAESRHRRVIAVGVEPSRATGPGGLRRWGRKIGTTPLVGPGRFVVPWEDPPAPEPVEERGAEPDELGAPGRPVDRHGLAPGDRVLALAVHDHQAVLARFHEPDPHGPGSCGERGEGRHYDPLHPRLDDGAGGREGVGGGARGRREDHPVRPDPAHGATIDSDLEEAHLGDLGGVEHHLVGGVREVPPPELARELHPRVDVVLAPDEALEGPLERSGIVAVDLGEKAQGAGVDREQGGRDPLKGPQEGPVTPIATTRSASISSRDGALRSSPSAFDVSWLSTTSAWGRSRSAAVRARRSAWGLCGFAVIPIFMASLPPGGR